MRLIILGAAILVSLFITRADAESVQLLLDRLARAENRQAAVRLEAEIWQGWIGGYQDDAQKALMASGMRDMADGRLGAAERSFSELIGINPDYVEAWNKRATIRYMMGDLDGSETDVFEVLSREPRHFGAISGLGLINLRRGELAKAANAYEMLLEVNPNSQNALDLLPRLRQQLGMDDI